MVTHSSFTPDLAKNINELLNAAENAVRQAQEDARKRVEQEQAEKTQLAIQISVQRIRRAG